MSPIQKSREIVEILSDNEHIRKYLHTAICKLESIEIDNLYKNIINEKKRKDA